MKRGLLIGGGVLIALVLVIVIVVVQSLDGIVKAALEHYGSQILGVEVKVASVSLSLREGRGTIREFRVANPEGYSSADAFTLGEITLGLDLESVQGSPLVIDEVTIRAPEVSYEIGADGKSNFDTISANVSRYGGGSGGTNAESDPQPMLIRKLVFEDGKIHARSMIGEERTLDVPLPALQMSDLGAPSGQQADAIGAQVLAQFTRQVVIAVGRSQVEDRLKKVLGDNVGEAASDAANKLLDRFR